MNQYHPLVCFIYFCLVIGCSMFFMHPICLLISLTGAVSYTIYLIGWQKAKKGLGGILFLMVLTAFINPAFSHQGVTVLACFPSGNALTLESVFFGVGAACMLAATLLWFFTAGEILTTDKIVYLFGKGFPVLGLILSMILGFIPKLKRKYSEIEMARQSEKRENERENGEAARLKGYFSAFRHGVRNLSILVTWMLEDAVEIADSMKARGYGIEGRTSFTIYRFTGRDKRMISLLVAEAAYVIWGSIRGAVSWDYYPMTGGAGFEIYSISIYVIYLMFCMEPMIESVRKDRKWKRLQSVI